MGLDSGFKKMYILIGITAFNLKGLNTFAVICNSLVVDGTLSEVPGPGKLAVKDTASDSVGYAKSFGLSVEAFLRAPVEAHLFLLLAVVDIIRPPTVDFLSKHRHSIFPYVCYRKYKM